MRTALLTLFLLPAACGDADVVGAHMTLHADGTGTIAIRSLLPSDQPGPAEGAVRGVQFIRRAQLTSSTGTFDAITDVDLGGVRVSKEGDHSLRVSLPRGADAAWPSVLAPELEAQGRTARTFDPSTGARNLGATVRLAIEVPGEIVSLGCYPAARGVEWDKEKRTAYLWVPVRTALEDGDSLLWDISWKE